MEWPSRLAFATKTRLPAGAPAAPAPRQVAGTAGGASVPLRADLLIAMMACSGALAVTLSVWHLGRADVIQLLPLLILTAAVQRLKLGLYVAETHVSLSVLGSLAAGMLLGPPGAIVSSTVAAVAGVRRGSTPRQFVFNLGTFSICNGVGAAVFAAVGLVAPGGFPTQFLGAIGAALTTYLGETMLVSLIIGWTQGRAPAQVWRDNYRWQALHWLGFGVVALGLTLAYRSLGIVGLLTFACPSLLMRYAMKQYVDHTMRSVHELQARNEKLEIANREIAAMSVRLQEAYVGTLDALVAALDARDRETYGHSTRVSRLTMRLAREIGVLEGTQEWIDMQQGALLHDVGKIGVSDAILHKPGKLTDSEWIEMRRHADIGYGVLKDVPFLSGASAIVAAHHERWDGKGYPNGLAGDEIPLGARIFMLADTFDAMATNRPYRRALPYPAIREELERCAGTQFDPIAVASLDAVFNDWIDIHRQGLAEAGLGRLAQVA